MLEEVERWLTRRSWSAADRTLDRLLVAKAARGTTVSVVLPALDEEATVGAIVSVIRRELMERAPLVDELVVIDSGSSDRTAEVAAAAGARVVHRDAILPRLPALPGKGEVLWRSLLVTSGDVVCFVDADLRRFSADFVSGTVGPLLTDSDVHFVKAMYDRPLRESGTDDEGADEEGAGLHGTGASGGTRGDGTGGDGTGGSAAGAQGGRVTELVARPLLNLHWPQLAGFVQPLGGEYAARRSLLERLPFPVGYGVELGLLVDALHTVGLDALGQVDVGVRLHRHQDDRALGRMAAAIYRTAQLRLSRAHLVRPELTQFDRGEHGFVPRTYSVDTEERPPIREIAEYTSGRAA
ncbi:glucosyl-3-phosphoglycerate synthase [Streptomyces sp. NPDC050804]|uniref:glucosyl-3-phosphoglycerate synthase n=1 Tax=unclassified Streptomyces TaxID=2593676 RepID=UPI003428934D|nr:glucosyl-3-phosphoglycerate synthase [Streptomyces sp. NBC_00872]